MLRTLRFSPPGVGMTTRSQRNCGQEGLNQGSLSARSRWRASLHCLAPVIAPGVWTGLCSSAIPVTLQGQRCSPHQEPLPSLLLRQCWSLAPEFSAGEEMPLAVQLSQASSWASPLKDTPVFFLNPEMMLLSISLQHLFL